MSFTLRAVLKLYFHGAYFIALCLPSTSGTRHIITKKHFDLMKQGAIIVNVGRGTAIDQEALVQALAQRKIAGAGLDVTTPEPSSRGASAMEDGQLFHKSP
jgi:phosphoglycerate dehydrogenase-like enzyme